MNTSAATVRLELGARSYHIHVDAGSLGRLGQYCRGAGLTGKAALVSSPPVRARFGETAAASLRDSGFEVIPFSLPDGEAAKSLAHAGTLLESLAEAGMERSDPVIALGGGTIGDTAGFVAATYLRGVPLVHVPTTLLAQVDSAIGGKTGVNLEQGKNLVGAIWQPRLVLCDPTLLSSLPVRDVASGLAEVVKYGLIAQPSIISDVASSLQSLLSVSPLVPADLVCRCVQIKSEVVSADERESGRRRVLNFGHTFGHALEAATEYGRLLHGEAVALGMLVAMELSVELAGISRDDLDPARSLLDRMFGALSFPDVGFDTLAAVMARDKKVVQGNMIWVLLSKPGRPVLVEVKSMSAVARAFETAKNLWSSP